MPICFVLIWRVHILAQPECPSLSGLIESQPKLSSRPPESSLCDRQPGSPAQTEKREGHECSIIFITAELQGLNMIEQTLSKLRQVKLNGMASALQTQL